MAFSWGEDLWAADERELTPINGMAYDGRPWGEPGVCPVSLRPFILPQSSEWLEPLANWLTLSPFSDPLLSHTLSQPTLSQPTL
jgi:hypothetical protein